jgi:Flp pilus assembly protein TadG
MRTTTRPAPQARRTGSTDRGAAAVEMAILLPLLLLIIFGLVDFGLALRTKIALTSAAREGVRLSALGEPSGTVQARVTAAADPVPVDTVVVSGCASGATDATVTVSQNYTLLTPVASLGEIFGGGLPTAMTIRGKGVMRCAG